VEERPQVEFGKRSTHKVSQALYDQIRWNAVCGESCTHGVEPGKSWRSYQMLTYGYLVLMLMYGKEASNRKQEIDRQHYTIPNQRPKDKHCGKI
jgi:hypothetical protein